MPEDGNCLYHGIGYHVGMTQRQVRQTLADMGKEHWGELCYWAQGQDQKEQEWKDFKAQTMREGVWGGALQMAVAAKVWNLQISVHHQRIPKQSFGQGGEELHLYWHGGEEELSGIHYDVLEKQGTGGLEGHSRNYQKLSLIHI